MTRAVVFAYHDVGVRCLSVLLARGIDVALVVTHEDDPNEDIWFASVAELAHRNDIPTLIPARADTPEIIAAVATVQPDFLFSFYYRYMLGAELLALPTRGAYNMHGSLLPHYRGRVPINWAVLQGASRTGASLHRMTVKPDAGDLVAQHAVPILPNDTAFEVFHKVTCAAECCLDGVLEALCADQAVHTPLDLASGSYFGRRRPEEGRIDWSYPAQQIHNLIRAVAPPYPGAFFEHDSQHIRVLGSQYRAQRAHQATPRLYAEDGRLYADCIDGKRFGVIRLECNGQALDTRDFIRAFGPQGLRLAPASNQTADKKQTQ